MPLVYIRPIGDGLAYVHAVEGPVDPGFGGGRPGGVDPGYGRPEWGDRPNQGLPGQGHIDNSLPGGAGHPDNRPPSGPPPQVGPGEVLVLIRDQAGVWHYAAIAPGSPPPRPLPVPPPNRPDQGLPPHPSQGLPGGPPPVAGQPLPPTAAPKK